MDVNRQAWTAPATLLVHPADLYVGLRSERSFVQKGEPIALDAIVTDLDGRAAVGRPVRLTAERLEWEQVRGEWQEVAARPRGAHPRARRPSRVACTFRREGGRRLPDRWRASPTRRAARTRAELRVWVAGRQRAAAARGRAGAGDARARRQEYRRATSRSCWCSRRSRRPRALLTLRRSGLVRERALHDRGGVRRRSRCRSRTASRRTCTCRSTSWARRRATARRRRTPERPRGRPSPAAASSLAVPPPLAHARARGDPARAGARARRRDRARPVAEGRRRARRSRTARSRWSSSTRPCSRSRATGCPTRSPSSTRGATPDVADYHLRVARAARDARTSLAAPCERAGGRERRHGAPSRRGPLPASRADAEDGRAGEGRGRAGRRARSARAPTSRARRCSPRACRPTRRAARACP